MKLTQITIILQLNVMSNFDEKALIIKFFIKIFISMGHAISNANFLIQQISFNFGNTLTK